MTAMARHGRLRRFWPHPRGFAILVVAPLAISVCAGSSGCLSRTHHESEANTEASAEAARPSAGSSHYATPATHAKLSGDERRQLLTLARFSLNAAVKDGTLLSIPAGLTGALVERKGSFVTLTVKGDLRGCIGNIFPDKPLAEAVVQNAYSAALNDSRFSPVVASELPTIEVEVSVLTVPTALDYFTPDDLLHKLRPHVDGVVLHVGMRRATFLPQVWEQLPDPTDFLDHLSMKAGSARGAWKSEGTRVQIYQVEAFKESDPH